MIHFGEGRKPGGSLAVHDGQNVYMYHSTQSTVLGLTEAIETVSRKRMRWGAVCDGLERRWHKLFLLVGVHSSLKYKPSLTFSIDKSLVLQASCLFRWNWMRIIS